VIGKEGIAAPVGSELDETFAPITSHAVAESGAQVRANMVARKKFLTLASNFLAMKV